MSGIASISGSFQAVLGISMPSGFEMVVILVIALLLFGRRLPEVMRSMGRGVVEFKKGIKGIEDDVDVESAARSRSSIQTPAPGPTAASTAPTSPAPGASERDQK